MTLFTVLQCISIILIISCLVVGVIVIWRKAMEYKVLGLLSWLFLYSMLLTMFYA